MRILRKLFADDPKRGERLTVEALGINLDYSKNLVTDETLKVLVQLADESGLQARTDAMVRGEEINITEKRAVLHVDLRAMPGSVLLRNRHEERRGRFQHIRLGRRCTTREAAFTFDHLRDARAVPPESPRN